MTMTNKKKVLKGLKHCLLLHSYKDIAVHCVGCPYSAESGTQCERHLYANVKKLLKAPKAKVLNKSEIRAHIGEVLWMESEPDESGHLIPLSPVALDDICTDVTIDGEYDEVLVFSDGVDSTSEYNRWYRLWTARPTEEQRKAVKWG